MKEREYYHDVLQQTLLSGDALRQRLRADALDAERALPRQRRGRGRPRIARLAGYAAAALVLCFGTAMSIPTARAAILQVLHPAVDTGEYLSTPAQERVEGTAIEEAVEPIEAGSYTVVVAQAADDGWRAWAERLTLTLGELLYDGETLHLSGTLAGNTADFIRPESEYLRAEADEGAVLAPLDDMIVGDCSFSAGGAPAKRLGLSILDAEYAVALDRTDYDGAVAAGSLPVLMSLPVGSGLTGEQTLSLEILFFDMRSLRQSGEEAAPLATLRVEGLTFDATAGSAAVEALPLPAPVAMSGSAVVFMGAEQVEGDTALVGNELLPLEGAFADLPAADACRAGDGGLPAVAGRLDARTVRAVFPPGGCGVPAGRRERGTGVRPHHLLAGGGERGPLRAGDRADGAGTGRAPFPRPAARVSGGVRLWRRGTAAKRLGARAVPRRQRGCCV